MPGAAPRDTASCEAPRAAPRAFRFASFMAGAGPAKLRQILARAARPGVISFAIGLPAEDLLPVRDLAAAQARVLPHSPAALQYGVPYEPLKRQIVELMAMRGVTCEAEQVFLTTGAQQGMDLVARLFADHGGTVLLERTVYEGIQLALKGPAPRLLTLPTHPEAGLDVEAVASWLASGIRPQLLYAIPGGHNPLGVTLSSSGRRRLAELARDRGFPVLEDDAYGFLHYDGVPPPALRALDDRWILYLGSFSKILAPALRAGWLVVPPELVAPLSALKAGADIDTPSLGHRVISAYLDSGELPRHLSRLRTEYRCRRDTMLASLADSLPAGACWTRPEGGMFIWVELPPAIDAADLLETAIEACGVAFCPGGPFAVGGSRHADHCLRLCFTCSPPEQIAEGVKRLGRALAMTLERAARRRDKKDEPASGSAAEGL
jgi:2-aminoadipate transaminase